MVRGIIAAGAVCFVSMCGVADDNAKPAANPDAITFTPVQLDGKSAIQVSVGKFEFVAPKLVWRESNSKNGYREMLVADGRLRFGTQLNGGEMSCAALTLYFNPRQAPARPSKNFQ